MLRYNVNSGVKKIKTKTAIVASTIVLGLGGATFGLALPFAAHAAPSSCGAAHGAPGGLGAKSPYDGGVQGEGGDSNQLPTGTTAPSAGSQFGMEQGPNTGLNNKIASQVCNE